MMAASEPHVNRHCRILAETASLTAVVVGVLALAGWAWDVGTLLSVLPGYATMKPATAVCFILSGVALHLLRPTPPRSGGVGRRRVGGYACAAVVALIGLTTTGEYLLNRDLGIDSLLFPDRLRATLIPDPGRMSLATATNFVLIGASLCTLDAKSFLVRPVASALALMAGTIGLIAVLGYIFGVEALYTLYPYQSMALHTALTFIGLGVGVLCARPDRGMAASVTNNLVGALMARRLLPIVVALPIVLTWAGLTGVRSGLYPTEFGFAIVTTATIFLIAAVVWLNAGSLNRMDTERRQAETALRNSENRLRTIIRTEPECVKLVNAECELLDMNPAGLAMVEADSTAQIIGRNILPLLEERFRLSFQDLNRRVFRGESGTLEFEIIGLKGTRRWLSTHASPLRDADGRVSAALSVTRDITGQKQAEAERLRLEHQLQQSHKLQALGTLAGGVAHDFNNILTIISGHAELAAASVPSDHPARQHVQAITRAGARAAELVRRILLFSRPQDTDYRPVNLPAVVDEAVQLLRATLPTTIEIRTQFASRLPTIVANAAQIHQIVMNLGSNAAYAMRDQGGVLEVRLEPATVGDAAGPDLADLPKGSYVRLSVTDTGCGMDPATLERIFEPFFTTKSPGQGTGLGLSVVHGIINGHHGAISVESGVGRGTAFHLYLPAAHAPADDTPPTRPYQVPGRGEHILFVDDEEDLVLLMTEFLERIGYRISGFTNPTQALDAFQSDPDGYDVVVTDVSMPGISGFDLARHILLIRPAIPVVMASGYVQPTDQAAARALGVRELILKPNTIHEIGNTISRVLQEEVIRRTTSPSD
ncbi:MAG: hybrid sensor histidine kinase/response regulator [Nitrospirota bacterium]